MDGSLLSGRIDIATLIRVIATEDECVRLLNTLDNMPNRNNENFTVMIPWQEPARFMARREDVAAVLRKTFNRARMPDKLTSFFASETWQLVLAKAEANVDDSARDTVGCQLKELVVDLTTIKDYDRLQIEHPEFWPCIQMLCSLGNPTKRQKTVEHQ